MRRLIPLILFCVTALAQAIAANVWEATDKTMPATERAVAERADTDTPEVWVKDGYIYITAQRPVTVKIFSILGQQISQETVPAGTYRLHIASRGIYILRAGTLTRRITL